MPGDGMPEKTDNFFLEKPFFTLEYVRRLRRDEDLSR